MGKTVICAICGHEFEYGWNQQKKYCSYECVCAAQRKRQSIYRGDPLRKWWQFKARNKRRNFPSLLSYSEYLEIKDRECFYCGQPSGGGLDRLNSNEGYSLDNVVACCGRCNKAKLTDSPQEFIDLCKLIASRFNG